MTVNYVSTVSAAQYETQAHGDRDWRADSLCKQHPTQWWFGGGHRDTQMAKSICGGCGVRAACLEFAVSRPDLLGIWASTTPGERAAIRRTGQSPASVSAAPARAFTATDVDIDLCAPAESAARSTEFVPDKRTDIVLVVETGDEPVCSVDPPGLGLPTRDSRRGPRRGMARDLTFADHGDLLTPAEAARKLGVTPNTVTRWSRAGKISAIQTMGGHRRFRRSEIERVQREANLFSANPF